MSSIISLNDVITGALQHILEAKFPRCEYSYNIKKASAKGDNYIGEVFRIFVEVNANRDKQFKLILKLPPQNLIRRKQFFARPCFLRESLAYEEFLPIVNTFQITKGILPINPQSFHEYAECYYTLTDEMNEAIFMEDLCDKNFDIFNRFEQLTMDHVTLVLRIYAKLHAVSFAIKDQKPELFEKFRDIKDIFQQRKDDSQLAVYFEELKKSTLACVYENDKSHWNKLHEYFEKSTFFELILPLIDGKLNEPHAVICHGDCWNNNIMFKHENEKVTEARLIDWQIMRYASPITDLAYFIFSCTTQEFRINNYELMLDTYYREFEQHVKRLGSEPKNLFSRDTFNTELKKKGAIGLL
ncbi:uncharacterized protein LOC119666944, partial [Teleopsis dalmanni]|uniref:uncharacterized protein LOC119666944 n=1 Tax=Teleopsis dalmanni TaxID=139649 RepID=UPI0018CD2B47